MSAENGSPGVDPEQISFSNVQVQIVLARHAVTTEREFADNRKAIEGVGEKFFKRGFTNIYLQEEAGGAFASVTPLLNSTAIEHRSYRTAFWQIIRKNTVERSKELTSIFEENPVERFLRSRRKDGLSDEEIHIEAFLYAGLTALDSLGRKGLQIKIAGEQPSKARKMMTDNTNSLVEEWRRKADLAKQFDISFVDQLKVLLLTNPNRSRIMTIYGGAHRLSDHLPDEIKQITRTSELFPGASQTEFTLLMHAIQDGLLTDEEIMERINRNPDAFLAY